jgi:polyhydroxyalkanoate synthesis regulator phasin
MTEEQRRGDAGEGLRDGVRAIFGVVGALKDAVEETFQELLDRGELSPERAREAARSTVKKAQDTVEDMRDRLDFITRREFDELRAEVAQLRSAFAAQNAAGATQATTPAPEPAEPPPPPGPAPPPPEPPPLEAPDQEGPRFTIDDA